MCENEKLHKGGRGQRARRQRWAWRGRRYWRRRFREFVGSVAPGHGIRAGAGGQESSMRAVPRSLSACLWVGVTVGKAEHCQGACHTGGNTPPADTDVAVPALQRQMHEGGGRERPLVGSCAQHAAKVQVPSGLGHCETLGPWTDAGTAPTSSPEMCVSAHSVMPRTRTSGLGH